MVRFVDIGGIVDHHCLNFFYSIITPHPSTINIMPHLLLHTWDLLFQIDDIELITSDILLMLL
jgi:hypothetical protein